MVSFLHCCLEEEIGEVLRMQIAVRLSVRPVTFAKVLVRSSHLQTNEIRRKFENDTCGQWECGVHDANCQTRPGSTGNWIYHASLMPLAIGASP